MYGQYRREFGFVLEGRSIVVDDVRVRATGRAVKLPRAESVTQQPGRDPGTDNFGSARVLD